MCRGDHSIAFLRTPDVCMLRFDLEHSLHDDQINCTSLNGLSRVQSLPVPSMRILGFMTPSYCVL